VFIRDINYQNGLFHNPQDKSSNPVEGQTIMLGEAQFIPGMLYSGFDGNSRNVT
jgi:hypothetical protein